MKTWSKAGAEEKIQNHTKPMLLTKVQANLVILPGKYAEQFRDFCSLALDLKGKNSKAIDANTDGFVVRTSKHSLRLWWGICNMQQFFIENWVTRCTVILLRCALHTYVAECACRGVADVPRFRTFYIEHLRTTWKCRHPSVATAFLRYQQFSTVPTSGAHRSWLLWTQAAGTRCRFA